MKWHQDGVRVAHTRSLSARRGHRDFVPGALSAFCLLFPLLYVLAQKETAVDLDGFKTCRGFLRRLSEQLFVFFLLRFMRTFEVVRAENNVYDGAADVDAEQNQKRCIHFTKRETHTAFPGCLLSNGDAVTFYFPAWHPPCGKWCADGLHVLFRFLVFFI